MASRRRRSAARRMLALAPVLTLLVGPWSVTAPAAEAAGASTAGVMVVATNPPGSGVGSGLELTLVARTEADTLSYPSCRPQDSSMRCWGALVLRVPDYGDLAVGDFEVHRVAVGDISCDDSTDGGCGDHSGEAAALAAKEPVLAQVNGTGVVKWPGNSGLPVGTKLQLKFTFTDNGPAAYGDLAVLQISLFTQGPNKPVLYTSPPEPVQQVRIQYFKDKG